MDDKNINELINLYKDLRILIENIETILEGKIHSDFMTIKESAIYARCSAATIREIIRSGQLRYSRINESPKSTILIKRDDLKKFIIKRSRL